MSKGLVTVDGVLTDKGSKYSVSGAPAQSKSDVLAVVKDLKRNKKFGKATHNTWGVVFSGGPLKNDDGESGAGSIILRMLERAEVMDHVVIVTRWYGGKDLGGDRFRHVQTCVETYLNQL